MKKVFSFALLLLAVVAIGNLFGVPAARSYQSADAKPTKWEYLTEAVEVASMQAKLIEWSNAQWEVIAFAPVDSLVDSSDNEKPRLRVEKYQFVARRPMK